MANLIGNLPNQIPTNGDLGTMAFQDSNSVNIIGGTVNVSAGTAALPTLGTTGDANTGVFFPAADTMAVATNGVERVRVTDTGNVGIGTASPSAKLHLSSTTATVYEYITSPTGFNAGIDIQGNGTTALTTSFSLLQGASSEAYVYQRANSFMAFASNNLERMRIHASGGISIGNTVDKGAGSLNVTGLIYPQQATTALAPAYVKGAIYFDTTLNKLRVGGATAWETVTSV